MSNTQEKYVHSLKQIKIAEENAQAEIDEHRKKIAEEIRTYQIDMDKAIATAKANGEKLVEASIAQAKSSATIEMERIINDAKTKAKTISTQMNAQTVREIIDILLKGVE